LDLLLIALANDFVVIRLDVAGWCRGRRWHPLREQASPGGRI